MASPVIDFSDVYFRVPYVFVRLAIKSQMRTGLSSGPIPYFTPTEREKLLLLKSAKAYGKKRGELPAVVNLKSGW